MLKKTIEIIDKNRIITIPFVIIWLCALIFAFLNEKQITHLILNSYRSDFLDTFFKYYTETGGTIPFIIIFIALFIKYRYAAFMASTQLLSVMITYPLKHLFKEARPVVLFEQLQLPLPIVEGVKLHHSLSFPSGHTTAAFAIFITIAVLCKRPWQKIISLLLAILTGMSRIYLSQHFLQDVIAGSLIGTISVFILAPLFVDKQWGNNNIMTLINKK